MRIVDVREVTKPIASPIRNAYIDFSKMTASLVAVVTDVERDGRRVVGDPHALYFGAELTDTSLLPSDAARIATLRFEDWLRQSLQPVTSPTSNGKTGARA